MKVLVHRMLALGLLGHKPTDAEIHVKTANQPMGRLWCPTCILAKLLLLIVPGVVQAQFTFTTNDGAITITGYFGANAVVTIPSSTNGYPVTSIGAQAFSEGPFPFPRITSVTIPDSVTSIGEEAFCRCPSLASVSIGSGVTHIGDMAFDGCASLTSVRIPNSVTSIGEGVFFNCPSLTAIMVETRNSAYCDVDGVLFNQSQTTLIQYPGGIAGSYKMPSSVTNIAAFAFGGSSLTSVTIPDSVTSIGEEAFLNCASLTNAMIGNGVTNIEDAAFFSCTNLTSVVIGNGVINIGDGAFYSCTSLTSVTVPNSATSIGLETFWGCASLTNAMIGNSVRVIGDYAFERCASLTSITIPSSVTNIGVWAFDSCTGLVSVVIGNGVRVIGGSAFEDCTSLASITIPDSVTDIGMWAFGSCTSLMSVVIGNGVSSIGDAAFKYCSSLTNVTIPSSVTSIGDEAFNNCTSLTGVCFRGNAPIPGLDVFDGDTNATVYYLPGTTGWGVTYGGLPTALWQPCIQASDSSFGVRTNQFGFNVAWASGMVIVVEACTNLANPFWSPLQTNTLTGDSVYFSDPAWTNYSKRFYRIRSP